MCCIWSHICLIHVPVILHNALSLIFIHYRQNYAVTNLLYSMHITLTWTSLVFSLHFVKYVKVKCILVQALRLCTDRTAHRGSRGIALLFLDYGTRRGWGVSVMPWPLFTPGKDPVPIVQEAVWAPGPVWTGAENLAPTGIRSPDRPARSQSLYRLSYPAHLLNMYHIKKCFRQ